MLRVPAPPVRVRAAVVVRGLLQPPAFLPWLSRRCHVVRQPLDARDQPYKFIIYLEGRIRVRGQFPSWCEPAPRELPPAPAAAQSEGFSFTVPKVTLLVNADHSSLV